MTSIRCYRIQAGLAVAHTFGEGNFAADCLSRGYRSELLIYCAQIGVKPIMVEVPTRVLQMLDSVVQFMASEAM